MATIVITDAKLYLAGYNLSGVANEIVMSITPEMLDETTFGSSRTKKYKPGLSDWSAEVKGFNDFSLNLPPAPHPTQTVSVDSLLQSRIGAVEEVFSAAPVGNSELDTAYTLKGVNGKYEPVNGAIGVLLPFSIDMNATGVRMVRGQVMGVGTKTVTGQSAAGFQRVGGLVTGLTLYAALHVVAAAGTTPTLNVIVESDDNSGFTTPTTRLTFPQFTTSVGSSWQSLAGPVTDDFYRMKWTITGTSPQYTIFGVVGIL